MSTQYFGRAFKVTVHSTATGEDWVVSNSTWGNEALKVTFAIEQQANSAWFAADVVLWNFDPAASQVIQKGDLITVEAGYQSPGSGVIFSGRIFQTLSERVSQTDNALTLHCLFGQWEDENGYVSVQFSKGYTQDQAVRLVASQAGIAVAYLDPALAANPYLKGQSFAGIARRFFDDRWIDAPTRPGKAPGAFAHPTVPSAHPYVLLNYQGKPRDVMTLAHELGHGVHEILAREQG